MTDPALAQAPPVTVERPTQTRSIGATAVLRSRLLRLAPIVARWVVIVLAVLIAYRGAVAGLARDFAQGVGLAYLPAIPVFAAAAALLTRWRDARSIEIHDRETDIIVGVICTGSALMIAALLGDSLSAVYRLWRIDLLTLVLMAFGGATLLFGLRRTVYYRWAWFTLLLLWPLPGRIIAYTVGGGDSTALALVYLGTVCGIQAVLRPKGDRRWLIVPAVALIAGLAATPLTGIDLHPDRVAIPALIATAVGLIGLGLVLKPQHLAPRALVVKRPLGAAAILAVVSLVGSQVIPPPSAITAPTVLAVDPAAAGPGSLVPTGWTLQQSEFLDKPRRYFGRYASWQRLRVQAEPSAPQPDAVDPLGRPREMVIDVLTTRWPRTLATFPVVTTYEMGSLEVSPDTHADLGGGVVGALYSAVDVRRQLTWTMLSFEIELPAPLAVDDPGPDPPATLAQRITLITVDDHRLGAPFPEPNDALVESIVAAGSAVIRGGAQDAATSSMKDQQLIVAVAQGLVAARAAGAT